MKFSKEDTLAIKGIAILMLIQHHNFFSKTCFEGYSISFFPFSASFIISVSSFMKICVGIFAFLSGYGLTLSLKKYSKDYALNGEQYKRYMYLRLFKMMSGYWFIFIVAQIACAIITQGQIKAYFSGSGNIVQGIYQIIIDFFGLAYLFGTGTLNGTWWYMCLAIFIVIAVPFIAKALKKYNIMLLILLCIFIPRMFQFGMQYVMGESNNIIRWMIVIIIGVACAQYDVLVKMKSFMLVKNKTLNKLIKFIIATAILILLYIARDNFGRKFANYSYEIRDNLIPFYMVYYCYEFIIDIPILKQILRFLGKHSMNIFLIHTFIRHYMLEKFVYSFHYFWLVTLVVLIISLAISIVIEFMKKYLGYNKLIQKITEKISAALDKRETVSINS